MRVYIFMIGFFLFSLFSLSDSFSETQPGSAAASGTMSTAATEMDPEEQAAPPESMESRAGAATHPQPDGGDTEKKDTETADGASAEAMENTAIAPPVTEKKPAVQDPYIDRPWIIKMQKQPGRPVEKPVFEWDSEHQQQRCETLQGELLESYNYARRYSINGDGCNTAGYAERFLALKTACDQECPAGFLEKNGYNETIVRNIGTLLELGTKRCLGGQPLKKAAE